MTLAANRKCLAVLLVAMILPALACAQGKSPTEAQCREMVNGMLQTMKSTPFRNDKEKRDAQVLIDRADKVVRENRSRGASECDSWAAIGKMVANQ